MGLLDLFKKKKDENGNFKTAEQRKRESIGHIGIHVIHEKEVRESDEKISKTQMIIRWKWIILAL